MAEDFILPALRATQVALTIGKYPTSPGALTDAAIDATSTAFSAAKINTKSIVNDIINAAAGAAFTSYDIELDKTGVDNVDLVISYARFNHTASVRALNDDVRVIENGNAASKLASRKLWIGKRPAEISKLWTGMKQYLLGRDEDWEVWTKWYDDRLNGRASIKDLEIERVLIAEDIWREGPEVVNAEIKRLIERFTPIDPKVAKEALKQRPAAFKFQVVDDKIDAASEDAVTIDKQTAEDLYEETKRKAEAFKERLARIQADEHLRENVDRLLDRLGKDYQVMRPGLILSSRRSLEADVLFYDTEEGRKELLASDLSKLADLAATARDLTAVFPITREIEAEIVAQDLRNDQLPEVETHVTNIVEAIEGSDGATPDAKDAINETVAGVSNARNDNDRAKQLSYALLDIGNFAREGLTYVKSSGRKIAAPIGKAASVVSSEVAGLGKDGWRAIRKEMPKGVGAGARVVGKAMIVGGATALMGHLTGDIAALGTFVGSYLPLGKIAKSLTDRTDDHTDSEAEELETGEEKESEPAAPTRKRAGAAKAKPSRRTASKPSQKKS